MKRLLLATAALAASVASAAEPAVGCNLGLPGRHFECDSNGQYCKCVVDDPAVYPLCEIRVMYRFDRPDAPTIMVPSLPHCTEAAAALALNVKAAALTAGERLPRDPPEPPPLPPCPYDPATCAFLGAPR